ncbi:MAG TPA: hypothetical protein VN788_08775, partial [Verrucomicrobiae bacterium]|nr:hypothetical protein [Verrucomicrobiae bacterium]
NRGVHMAPAAMHLALPRFAQGGLVSKDSANAGATHTLQVGLEEGLVVKHLRSKGAGRAIVEQLANNPKTANRALGRAKD